jgi:hypothetical protein
MQAATAVAVLIAAASGILALIAATSGRSEGSVLRSLPAVAFLATTTFIVESFGAVYLLFPELAALAYGVFARPSGAWARSPFMLVATPSLTAIIGTLATRHFAYGLPSLALTIAGGVVVLRLLGSPIVPALSAGVLPLTLGVSSWWYPPTVFLNASILALLSLAQQRFAFVMRRRRPRRTRKASGRSRSSEWPCPSRSRSSSLTLARRCHPAALSCSPRWSSLHTRCSSIPTAAPGPADPSR